MKQEKCKADLIDDMNRYLKQSEALTMTLECADLHNPSPGELNGIFSLLNELTKNIQKSFKSYVENTQN